MAFTAAWYWFHRQNKWLQKMTQVWKLGFMHYTQNISGVWSFKNTVDPQGNS